MKASQVEIGATVILDNGVKVQRSTLERYRASLGMEVRPGYVPFSCVIGGSSLVWYLVEADAELTEVEE